MDKYKIDSHKLMHHPERVGNWAQGRSIYPIYMEISPAGACNHRCTYCGLDFMGYKPRFLETRILKDRLREMGKLGVKSIMYAGEGEPLLHRDITDIIAATKRAGIDAAVTSNAVLFNEKLAEAVLPHLTWFKASINAAKPATYARIHGARPGDLDRALKNMAYAAKICRQRGYSCTLGIQIILLPENAAEIVLLARKAKDLGMDYFVVKPYSHNPQSKTRIYKGIKYGKNMDLAEKLEKMNDARFHTIFRIRAMRKWDEATRDYKHCLALPFWAHIDAGGDVWACSMYLTQDEFRLGNIYKNTFKKIWESPRRARLVRWAAKQLNTDKCRVNCRMDEINRYLWELKNPSAHVNFI